MRLLSIPGRMVAANLILLVIFGVALQAALPLELALRGIWLLGAFTLPMIVVALWVGRSVASPLAELQASLDDSRKQARELTLKDRGSDEVARLGRAIADFAADREDRARAQALSDAEARSERDRRLAEGERREGNLKLLFDLGHSLHQGFDFQESAYQILTKVTQTLGLEWSSLQIYDARGTAMRLVASVGLDANLTEELRAGKSEPVQFSLGEGISGETALKASPLVFNKGEDDARFKHFPRPSFSHRKIQTLCCVPVLVEGKVAGVANFINIERPPVFDEDSIELLARVGELLGMVLKRSQSFQGAFRDAVSGLYSSDYFKYLYDLECERLRRQKNRKEEIGLVRLAVSFVEPHLDPKERSALHRRIGEMVRSSLRRVDAAHREGDHYTVVLPGTDSLGALFLAGRLKERIDHLGFGGGETPLFVTCGAVASSPRDVEDPAGLPDCLTLALKEALQIGDHRLVCFRPEHREGLPGVKPSAGQTLESVRES